MNGDVSQRIRALMVEMRVKQTELAPAIGMTQQALSDRLCGKMRWRVDEICQVAAHFDRRAAELAELLVKTSGVKGMGLDELESLASLLGVPLDQLSARVRVIQAAEAEPVGRSA